MTDEALKQHKLIFHIGEEKVAEKSDLNEEKKIQQFLHCLRCDAKFRHGGAFRRHKLTIHNENEEEKRTK